ncbi:hypothetical protein DTQ70_27115 [Runella sp. SP2]|nr:hypothetical protein DTQ70_27115 [Runella sp. SP2]
MLLSFEKIVLDTITASAIRSFIFVSVDSERKELFALQNYTCPPPKINRLKGGFLKNPPFGGFY